MCVKFISTNFNNYRLVDRLAVLLYYLTPLIPGNNIFVGPIPYLASRQKKAFDYVNMSIYDSFAHFLIFNLQQQ